MLPFCGYDMGDHFGHWLRTGRRESTQLPRIFSVNWFRKDEDGRFLWPGFGETIRVLEWIHRRCDGIGDAVDTPIGRVPGVLNVDGLSVDLDELLRVSASEWLGEIEPIRDFYATLPTEVQHQLDALERRLREARS
jgi:phosphoenolpyruvate carboxykinase (GTP)